MKKLSLILAAVMAAALLLTGCFGTVQPTPTQAPTTAPTATDNPVATMAPTATMTPAETGMPGASLLPDMTDGLNVAPSPSASTAP